uniref:Uncharacterized protein n=1 Tax=Rhizophora mucronata TaxID=61149 RepID=A0A2P2P9V2_RHIMU
MDKGIKRSSTIKTNQISKRKWKIANILVI